MAGLLELAGHRPPSATCTKAETRSCSVGSPGPTERRADGVAKLSYSDGSELIVICEMQNRWKDEKYYRIPGYMARAFEDYRTPVELLLLAGTDGLARRYRKGIALGPGNTITVRALGPGDFPDLTEPGDLPSAPVAVISVVLRGASPPGKEELVAANLDHIFGTMEPRRGSDYAMYSFEFLDKETASLLEALMKTQSRPYHSEWSDSLREEGLEKGLEKGLEEGLEEMRHTLFDLLAQKSQGADAEQRQAIEACRDLHQLRLWITEVALNGRFEATDR
ncbi:hypothetical protein [Glycomyces arizonensis]|uniref:hypothetical protein n=1 Tax=Glycomyces arizonensis TaxID=256035 RepID=UPI0012EB1593|nr:hypothetical protein [Glycomyces arizonensis]